MGMRVFRVGARDRITANAQRMGRKRGYSGINLMLTSCPSLVGYVGEIFGGWSSESVLRG
jgi:hypothetical protein